METPWEAMLLLMPGLLDRRQISVTALTKLAVDFTSHYVLFYETYRVALEDEKKGTAAARGTDMHRHNMGR